MGGVNDPIAHLGLLDDEEIQIELAALELSALDHEGVDLDPYVALLADMEEKLAAIAGDALDGVGQGRALAQVIGVEYGFTGDRASYDVPLNADMIRVIAPSADRVSSRSAMSIRTPAARWSRSSTKPWKMRCARRRRY